MKRLTWVVFSLFLVIGCAYSTAAFAWGDGPKTFSVEVACGPCGNSQHKTFGVCANDEGEAARKAMDIAQRTTCNGRSAFTCNVIKVKNNCRP